MTKRYFKIIHSAGYTFDSELIGRIFEGKQATPSAVTLFIDFPTESIPKRRVGLFLTKV